MSDLVVTTLWRVGVLIITLAAVGHLQDIALKLGRCRDYLALIAEAHTDFERKSLQ